MPEEIIKSLKDYLDSGEIINREAIEIIINLLVKYRHLEDYYKELYILPSLDTGNKTTIAVYNYNSKLLKISIDGIYKHLECNGDIEQKLDYNDRSYYRSLLVIQTLLHEFEHIRQNKVMTEKDTFESRLISSSLARMDERTYEYMLLSGFNKEEIKEYFLKVVKPRFIILKERIDISPTERMAEINSANDVLRIIRSLHISSSLLFDIFNKNLNASLLLGYTNDNGNISNPTDQFLNKLWDGIILDIYPWHSFIDYSYLQGVKKEFDLNKRLLYGLPIDSNEYVRIRMKQSIYNSRMDRKSRQ